MNQDRFFIHSPQNKTLAAGIADGMGGEPAGDIAAQMAVTHFEAFTQFQDKNPDVFYNRFLKKLTGIF